MFKTVLGLSFLQPYFLAEFSADRVLAECRWLSVRHSHCLFHNFRQKGIVFYFQNNATFFCRHTAVLTIKETVMIQTCPYIFIKCNSDISSSTDKDTSIIFYNSPCFKKSCLLPQINQRQNFFLPNELICLKTWGVCTYGLLITQLDLCAFSGSWWGVVLS